MERFMFEALKQAEIAKRKDEVPIGCVIVRNSDNRIIAKAYNKRHHKKDAIAHAEILAIKKACKVMKDWRLNDCTLYVTTEPCPMCAGAILNARIGKVVYGTSDLKSGFLGGFDDISNKNILNHNFKVVSGILEQECKEILQSFFDSKRNKQSKK
ncbi:MAG: tRNA adenosine(34) deaminase TadA [Clostridia bacterium]|nr:tRNA adenosine(34) deaminase TadA [Clostridia bacterium]